MDTKKNITRIYKIIYENKKLDFDDKKKNFRKNNY